MFAESKNRRRARVTVFLLLLLLFIGCQNNVATTLAAGFAKQISEAATMTLPNTLKDKNPESKVNFGLRQGNAIFQTETMHPLPLSQTAYPVCVQPPLTTTLTALDTPAYNYKIHLPAIFKAPSPPPCTVYCGLLLEDDLHQPAGYQTYFADEFNCNQLLDYWIVQEQMTAASYAPPVTGYVEVSNGSLKVGVPGLDTSFPYLYMVDDSATSYDVPHTATRVDWLPDSGNFRVAMRVRFNIDTLGEHRIAIYADGHRPNYAGPLFYIGTDYNSEQ